MADHAGHILWRDTDCVSLYVPAGALVCGCPMPDVPSGAADAVVCALQLWVPVFGQIVTALFMFQLFMVRRSHMPLTLQNSTQGSSATERPSAARKGFTGEFKDKVVRTCIIACLTSFTRSRLLHRLRSCAQQIGWHLHEPPVPSFCACTACCD